MLVHYILLLERNGIGLVMRTRYEKVSLSKL
jgi:hypothetical protein